MPVSSSPPFRFALQAMDLSDSARIAETARRAEALGYEELYSYDHLGSVDPFIPLVVAADATSTLRVGPLVLNNEFHHPALLARTAATVDRLTGGRLVLGMGTGYMQAEHDAMGLELRPPKRRVDRLEESLVALRSLLDTGEAHLDGEHHHLAVDRLGVEPLQPRVPILLGGHGPRVVALGARHADIFQFTGLTHGEGGRPEPGGFGLDAIEERARMLDEAMPPDRATPLERSVLVQVGFVGDDADDFVDQTADRFRTDRAFLQASPFVLCGAVGEVVEKLESLRAAIGVSHVVVRDAELFAPVVERLAGR